LWYSKRRRAQNDQDFETWIEGGVCPTLNAFDNTGDSRATVIVFAPGPMVRLGGNIWEGIVPTLRAEAKRGDAEPHILIIDGTRVDDVRVYEGPVQTLKERMGTGGNNVPIIAFDGYNQSVSEDVYRALRIGIDSGDCIAIPIDTRNALRDPEKYDAVNRQGLGVGKDGDPSPTITNAFIPAVAYSIREDATANTFSATEIQTARALSALRPSVQSHHAQTFIASEEETMMQVRRLTPTECERLMGWPDGHTLPRADGKQNADTTRYKMCGNGVASPVAQWIGEHIMGIGV
jgi:hypothetical protein